MTASPANPPPRRALIVGGGPAGLASAIALRGVGIEPLVVERVPEASRQGTGLTLWPNALAALATIGAADAVDAAGCPAAGNAMRSPGGKLLSFTSREAMTARYGGSGLTLHRAELLAALLDVLGRDAVAWQAECRTVKAGVDGVEAVLDDGRVLRGDLLVGADGVNSAVRRHVARGDRTRPAGFTVARGVSHVELADYPGTLTLGPGDQFGLFPMRGGRVYWFASVPGPASGLRDGGRDLLLARFGDWHDPVPAVLEASQPGEIVVTEIHRRAPARPRVAGRVVLVGDAAHPLLPNLGQGTCQAFEDAAVLAASLRSHPDLSAALHAYDHARWPRARWIAAQSRQLAVMGNFKNRSFCWLRDRVIQHAPDALNQRRLDRVFTFPAPGGTAPGRPPAAGSRGAGRGSAGHGQAAGMTPQRRNAQEDGRGDGA